MSIRHRPPRQHRPNVGRAPVARHAGQRSVGAVTITKQRSPTTNSGSNKVGNTHGRGGPAVGKLPHNSFFNPGSRRGTALALGYQQGQFGPGK